MCDACVYGVWVCVLEKLNYVESSELGLECLSIGPFIHLNGLKTTLGH